MPALVLLAACGFTPIYGTHTNGEKVAADLNQVGIANIPDRKGQLLRNDLIDRMYSQGRPQNPPYTLTVNLHSTEENLGILANETSTRIELLMVGDYILTDAQGKKVLVGSAQSRTNFDQLAQEYATTAAEQDAIDRTVNEIGNQIVARLSLYFAEQKVAPAYAPAPTAPR